MNNRLEIAAANLAKAALEFDEACTATYTAYYGNLYRNNDMRPSGKAQMGLQDTIQDLTRLNTYSAGQARAINACFSAWHPPKLTPAKLFPIGRSGGAA